MLNYEIYKQQHMKKMSAEQAAQIYQKYQPELMPAIQQKIFPALVSIVTKEGNKASGFFQHDNWLVTNAHVLPDYNSLQETKLLKYQNTGLKFCDLNLIAAYHRPVTLGVPDITIINTQPNYNFNAHSIPAKFTDDSYIKFPKPILFYAYFDKLSNANVVHFLEEYNTTKLPLQYVCMNDEVPRPGCSGAPIIEARLIGEKYDQMQWQFKTVGVVYARKSIKNDSFMLYAIPANVDFEQIRQNIIIKQHELLRYQQMYHACMMLKDLHRAKEFFATMQLAQEQNLQGMAEYKQGLTQLKIELEEGLEELIDKDISELKNSFLIHKKHNAVHLQDLQQDLNALLTLVSQDRDIKLKKMDDFYRSSNNYFRIDVGNGSDNNWKVDIQDNTGKGIKINGKSASAVFALVLVKKNTTNVDGRILTGALQNSLNTREKIQYEEYAAKNKLLPNEQPNIPTYQRLSEKEKRSLEYQQKPTNKSAFKM